MPERPIVLVTGASKGIGACTAESFATAGYDVCVNYRHDGAGADDTVLRCEAAGASAVAWQADVADREAVRALFAACDRSLGRVACVVNNAGTVGRSTALDDLDAASLHATFATNVYGTMYCLQEAAARMRMDRGGAGGVIVNLSSVAAILGSPGEYVHYAASKAAIETLTIGAAKELGAFGIRVNAVRVGTTDTDLHAREGNPDRPATVAAATPLGRIAQPEDIADAVRWLASAEAGFVSGTVLTVAGGLAP